MVCIQISSECNESKAYRVKYSLHSAHTSLFTDGSSPVGIVYPVNHINLTVEQSGSLVLECVVSGNPSPVAKWTKDGQELPSASRLSLLHSNLALSDVQLNDSGNYTCSVQTEEGALVSANYTLNVLGEFKNLNSQSDLDVCVYASHVGRLDKLYSKFTCHSICKSFIF